MCAPDTKYFNVPPPQKKKLNLLLKNGSRLKCLKISLVCVKENACDSVLYSLLKLQAVTVETVALNFSLLYHLVLADILFFLLEQVLSFLCLRAQVDLILPVPFKKEVS
jgi:hypothetical protein